MAKRKVRDNSALVKKYRNEPKVQVLGAQLYKQFIGDRLTYTLNGFPVSIKFDGTWQEYPASVAKNLQQKLADIAEAHAPKNVNQEINV